MRAFSLRFVFLISFCYVTALYASEDAEGVFKLAERFFNDSLYTLALEQYEKYLTFKRSPENDPKAYYKIAFCHAKTGYDKRAAESFEEYIRLYPAEENTMQAMYYAGVARKNLGHYKDALEWFYAVWSRFVGNPLSRAALYEAAFCAEKDKNTDRAIELYSTFLEKFADGKNAEQVSLSLIRLFLERKEYSQAEGILLKVRAQAKQNTVLHSRLLFYSAVLDMRMQKPESAEQKFQAVLQSGTADIPEQEQVYKEYIDLLNNQKKFAKSQNIYSALSAFYTAKALKPSVVFMLSWADNARRARLYTEAVALYERIIKQYFDDINLSQIQYRIAECLVGSGDLPKAIEMLRTIELSDSSREYSTKAILKEAELYVSKELYPSAISAYRRYLDLPDVRDKDRIIYTIGKIYQEKYERFDAALKEFDNILKWYPTSGYYQRTLFVAAQCQEALKDYRSAVRSYEYLIETGGDDDLIEKAGKRADYIRTFLMKDSEGAAYALAEIAARNPQGINEVERLTRTADIFDQYLKDFPRALELYASIDSLKAVPDSLKPTLQLKKAHIYRKMYKKAVIENDSAIARHAKDMSLKLYRSVIALDAGAPVADEAAYNKMLLTSPPISEYEVFIQQYPSSRFVAEVLLAIALYYEKNGLNGDRKQSQKAIQAYKEIVARFPQSAHSIQALVGMARNYLIVGQTDSAQKSTNTYLDSFAGSVYDAEVFYIRGILAKNRNDYASAADIFKQVLYRYPFSVFAEKSRYELAVSEQKLGRIFEALNNYRLYLQSYQNGTYELRAKYGVAKCQFQLDKKPEGTRLFNELLAERLPESLMADIHYELAAAAEIEGAVTTALEHYRVVLSVRDFPERMNVFKNMGNIYFANRFFGDAAVSFDSALTYARIQTDSVAVLTRSIGAYIMDGKMKNIENRIKRFYDIYGEKYAGNIAEIIYHEGLYLIVEKEYKKAINRFVYIIEKFPSSERVDEAAYQSALCAYYQNKNDEALALFTAFPQKYPESEFVPLAYFKMGMIFHGQNDFVKSAEYFSKVIADKKVDATTRLRAANNAAIAFQKTSQWLDAAKMYELVLTDYSRDIEESSYHLKAGFCFLQVSRTEEALAHLKKAIVNPKKEEEAEISYWLAACYAKQGDDQKAIAEYLKVPYLYTGGEKWGITSEFEAARLYEHLGEFNKAATLYRKIIRSDGDQGRFGRKALAQLEHLNSQEGEDE